MTTLEIVLIALSVAEAIVSAYLCRRYKKRLDNERRMYEDAKTEYETLIRALPIQRNIL
ncbi:hypothetical protein KL1_00050 [Burkholderia phage vB_BceS_KL1]|uniref:Uncharacterized protein n=1 Tax=Burkholderia phage vB_BceS_KL1 TaxID=1132026 RepID=I6NQT9_9CAUD|nr:hypothetical protein B612_gp50 [Burkholderia phage vB_BceS_KL1]AEX56085.1 hypothetical protein KL1_00050 [Burkholderia phage vB_BceS_KL1]